MSITSITSCRAGDITTVTVASDLSGVVFYHWYLDGVWLGMTSAPSMSLRLGDGECGRLDCIDTTDPAFDGPANSPDEPASRRTIWWVRQPTGVEKYRVEQRKNAGAWVSIGEVVQDGESWSYSILTDRLDDLADYEWRVIPIDAAGNEGTPVALAAETVVRRPDAPRFIVTFNEVPTTVTFAEA
jgi:hypothetical protein